MSSLSPFFVVRHRLRSLMSSLLSRSHFVENVFRRVEGISATRKRKEKEPNDVNIKTFSPINRGPGEEYEKIRPLTYLRRNDKSREARSNGKFVPFLSLLLSADVRPITTEEKCNNERRDLREGEKNPSFGS